MPSPLMLPGTLEVLDATPRVLRAIMIGMPPSLLEASSGEEWSPRDVLVHLASRQRAALEGRIRAMLDEEMPMLPGLAHERMVSEYALADGTVAEILDDHANARAEMMQFVRALTPEQFARTANLPAAGIVSAADVIHHVAFHDLVHVAQIIALISDPIERSRGAMRAFK